MYKLQQKDVAEGNLTISLPQARGGHAMVVVGNPPDYIMMFGGVTEEKLEGGLSVFKIKKTLNDLWVYHTGTRLWSQ